MLHPFSNQPVRGSRRTHVRTLVAAAVIVSLLVAGGLLSIVSAAPNADWTIEVTSQETLWVDANKCNAQGPRGAWLSFWVTNTTGATQDNVTVTISGFTGTDAALFAADQRPGA